MADSYVIDGYVFQGREDYERAQKERETISYLSAHSNMDDCKAVYKIYKTAIEKQSFQTVFGLKYMEELRKRLVDSEIVTEDVLAPIPVGKVVAKVKVQASPAEKKAGEDRQAYGKARTGGTLKNLLIAVLLVVIVGMLLITYNNQYSIFTYFTDYKENMREELLNEYEDWENAVREREKAVEEKEKELGMESQKPGE